MSIIHKQQVGLHLDGKANRFDFAKPQRDRLDARRFPDRTPRGRLTDPLPNNVRRSRVQQLGLHRRRNYDLIEKGRKYINIAGENQDS